MTAGSMHGMADSLIRLVKKKAAFQDQSMLVFDQLIRPVYAGISSVARIGIIPHGFLHHLPFAVLYDRDKDRLFIQSHDIFYLPSASVYGIAHKRNPMRKKKAAIFAKSEFREHSEWHDMPLPGTNAEKDSLIANRVFKAFEVFSDMDSVTKPPTEGNAKKYLNGFDIIHMATHGKLDPDSPLDSRIMLGVDKDNDGVLKTREIFNLDLNAYLVTLSACETGKLRGFDGSYAGDELTGLTRAFVFAGAASVVASLWKVHDRATALLMKEFYRNLQQYDKTRALNQAQRWMMENEEMYYFNPPYYWAAFAVFGDWQ
jgi:CHAT domain-containing protein